MRILDERGVFMDLLGKERVLVIGLAKSGCAAAMALVEQGIKVKATDIKNDLAMKQQAAKLTAKGVDVTLGRHPLELLNGIDLVVVSPGVPDSSPLMVEAKRQRIPIISEPELAYRLYPGPYLAITGSNGKTTTVTWWGKL